MASSLASAAVATAIASPTAPPAPLAAAAAAADVPVVVSGGFDDTSNSQSPSAKRTLRDKIAARKKLKAKRAVKEDPRMTLLAECAKNGWVDRLEKLLASDRCPSQAALDSSFLLAAEYGRVEILKILYKRESSLSYVNKKGEPAVILSARRGQIDVTRFLLELGANIETRDSNGDTPLLAAVEAGQVVMARWLLSQGADVNAMDDDRNSVLHVAAYNGNAELVQIVLEAGASTNVLNDEDETPLEIAKNAEIARVILDFCSNYKPIVDCDNPLIAKNPFCELPVGAASSLFWSSIGVGKDNYMFQSFGAYPFDRLTDTERIVTLTEIAEGISGYRHDVVDDILHESALFAVFSMMKTRVKKEMETSETDDTYEASYVWRKKILEAYEQLYETNASSAGLSMECVKRSVWSTVVDLLARHLFGESLWEKKQVFACPNAIERKIYLKKFNPSDSTLYFSSKLPSFDQLSQSAVQLTFKKLMTMSKNYLCEEVMEPSGCFCQDCIAEREVPLIFKLQFLEESAEERRKLKKSRKHKDKKHNSSQEYFAERQHYDQIIFNNRNELTNFWSSISTEEKWCLTEMQTSDLQDLIFHSDDWETLRSAVTSYTKYSWDDDRLEITEECVTVTDDMGDNKGAESVLHMMLDAVSFSYPPYSTSVSNTSFSSMNEEEWDFRGRRLLENLVLAEFARKIAAQYVLKKEESRAQRVALELELELLQEEEQQLKSSDKKLKKKKPKDKKKKKKGAKTLAKAKNSARAQMDDSDVEEGLSDRNASPERSTTHRDKALSSDFAILEPTPVWETPSANPFLMLGQDDKKASTIHSDKVASASLEICTDPEEVTVSATKDGRKSSSESVDRSWAEKQGYMSSNDSEFGDSNHRVESEDKDDCDFPEDWMHHNNGMMFICTDETFSDIMEMKLLGLPRQHLRSVRSLEPFQSLIFLFNISTRLLHGIFEPTAPGGENLNPHAWSRNKGYSRSSPFPAQIPFRVVKEFPAIPESVFRHLFPDGNRIRRLNSKQVREIVQLFVDSEDVVEIKEDLPKQVSGAEFTSLLNRSGVSNPDSARSRRPSAVEGVFDTAWNKEIEPISFMAEAMPHAEELASKVVDVCEINAAANLSSRSSSVQPSVPKLWKSETLTSWDPPHFSRLNVSGHTAIPWGATERTSPWTDHKQIGSPVNNAKLGALSESLSLFGAWDQVLKTSNNASVLAKPGVWHESNNRPVESASYCAGDIWSGQAAPLSTWHGGAQSSWDDPPREFNNAKWSPSVWGGSRNPSSDEPNVKW